MKIEKLHGLIAAPFTPMDNEGHLKLETIGPYAEHLVKSSVAGAFICGTTGEGISMTTEERKVVLEEWIKTSAGRLKIKAHVGGNCLSECKQLASHAQKVGAYSVAAYAPSFFRPGSEKELVSFLAPIAMSAPELPFYYYHIPSMTGVNMTISVMMEEAERVIPNFAGIKYTHFDMYDMQRCLAYSNGRYNILHGFDETLLCGLSIGVQSAIGSTYNYISMVYHQLWEAFNHSDMEKAREWQQYSVKVVNILNKYGGGVRAGKAIMGLIGIECGPCRLPISKFSREEQEAMKNELLEAGFFELYETNIHHINKGSSPWIANSPLKSE